MIYVINVFLQLYNLRAGVDTNQPDGTANKGTGGICPAGSKCPKGSSAPVQCEEQEYQDLAEQSTCKRLVGVPQGCVLGPPFFLFVHSAEIDVFSRFTFFYLFSRMSLSLFSLKL